MLLSRCVPKVLICQPLFVLFRPSPSVQFHTARSKREMALHQRSVASNQCWQFQWKWPASIYAANWALYVWARGHPFIEERCSKNCLGRVDWWYCQETQEHYLWFQLLRNMAPLLRSDAASVVLVQRRRDKLWYSSSGDVVQDTRDDSPWNSHSTSVNWSNSQETKDFRCDQPSINKRAP